MSRTLQPEEFEKEFKKDKQRQESVDTIVQEDDDMEDIVIMDQPTQTEFHFAKFNQESKIEFYQELDLDDPTEQTPPPRKTSWWNAIMVSLCMQTPEDQ